LAQACCDPSNRRLLQAIASDERVAELDWYSFSRIAHATNVATGREVIRTSNLSRAAHAVTPEQVDLLRRAWLPSRR
jgi:hypothetical protein